LCRGARQAEASRPDGSQQHGADGAAPQPDRGMSRHLQSSLCVMDIRAIDICVRLARIKAAVRYSGSDPQAGLAGSTVC
jgi:hypothetical protein